MCLLVLVYRVVDDMPLLVAANREEAYDRPGQPPQLLPGPLRAVGGVDSRAGGTWLGVNERGILVAVANRPKSVPPVNPPSRGVLVRDLLMQQRFEEAIAAAVRSLSQGNYAGCNVVCASPTSLYAIEAGDWLRVKPLPPGVHVVTNGDVNDPHDLRTRAVREQLGLTGGQNSAEEWISVLKDICRRTDPPALCVHGEDRGTVSSSIVGLSKEPCGHVYLHAQGPPDEVPYDDYSELLRSILKD